MRQVSIPSSAAPATAPTTPATAAATPAAATSPSAVGPCGVCSDLLSVEVGLFWQIVGLFPDTFEVSLSYATMLLRQVCLVVVLVVVVVVVTGS